MSDPTTIPEKEAEQSPEAKAPERPAPAMDRDERRARFLIVVGAVLLTFGIVLSLNDDDLARWMTVIGIAVSFLALHRFGRLGPAATLGR